MAQRHTFQIQTIKAAHVRSHGFSSAYSLPAVVEVAAVTGVALHAQVTGRPR